MATTCQKCGKKIGLFERDVFRKKNGNFLCNSCYQSIQSKSRITAETRRLEKEWELYLAEQEQDEQEFQKRYGEIINRINEWKKDGYNIDEIEEKLKTLEK